MATSDLHLRTQHHTTSLDTMFPPGIKFILQNLPSLLRYPLLLGLSLYAASVFLDTQINLPLWIQILILVLSPFAALPVKIVWSSIKKRQEARALGAVPPPVVKGSLPGNFDVARKLANGGKGYLGTPRAHRLTNFHLKYLLQW